MNIQRIPDDLPAEAARASAASIEKSTGYTRSESSQETQSDEDGADVSGLGKLMANAAKDLDTELAVRPEKVEAFKNIVQQPLDVTDKQIDTIFRRMFGL